MVAEFENRTSKYSCHCRVHAIIVIGSTCHRQTYELRKAVYTEKQKQTHWLAIPTRYSYIMISDSNSTYLTVRNSIVVIHTLKRCPVPKGLMHNIRSHSTFFMTIPIVSAFAPPLAIATKFSVLIDYTK